MKKPPKIKKPPPHEFVLDALTEAGPTTRPMFGCLAVYVGEKIVLILRDKGDRATRTDDGVWLATTQEHHKSLKKDFPSMRSIRLFADGGPTGWQCLPVESETFEEEALRACELVLRGDTRIGKIPAKK